MQRGVPIFDDAGGRVKTLANRHSPTKPPGRRHDQAKPESKTVVYPKVLVSWYCR